MGFFDWFRKAKPASVAATRSMPAADAADSHFAWAKKRVDELADIDIDAPSAGRRTNELLDAYAALRSSGEATFFGMMTTSLRLDAQERERLAADLRRAIIDLHAKHERAGNAVALYELSKLSDRLALPELKLTKRLPLRCDPLGSVESLSPEWRARIERLVRARDQKLTLDWQAVGATPLWEHDDESSPDEQEFGAPEPDALYTFALRYEGELDLPFSRELAAFFAVANGIRMDQVCWFFAPVREWTYEDEGLSIGSGAYFQGRLTLEPDAGITELAEVGVVMRDDDGEVLGTFENFGVLVDRLLPK